MSDETLFTAARRAIRDFNIDMNAGGLITPRTEQSMLTLGNMVKFEEQILRASGHPSVVGEKEGTRENV